MPRTSLPPAATRAIRQRLSEYVERFHQGDWSAFQKSVGLERTTIAGWKGGRRSTVPDVVALVQLAERLGISLDWLLLGRGKPLFVPTSPADSVPERFRAALAQHLGTAAPEIQLWIDDSVAHSEHPRAEHFYKVLPPAEDLLALAAELIRPLLRPALRALIDFGWRRGRWIRFAEEKGKRADEPLFKDKSALQMEQDDEERCDAAMEQARIDLIALARYAEELNRQGRPPIQIIDYDAEKPHSAWGNLRPDRRPAEIP